MNLLDVVDGLWQVMLAPVLDISVFYKFFYTAISLALFFQVLIMRWFVLEPFPVIPAIPLHLSTSDGGQ